MRNKLIAAAVALLAMFVAGIYVGYYKIPQPSTVDPQIYFKTVFTPYVDGNETVIAWLDEHQCSQSLYVADYTYTAGETNDRIVAVKTKYPRSDVEVLLDRSQTKSSAGSSEAPLIQKLRDSKIPVAIGTSPTHGAIMHEKFMICDMKWVLDGSFNYTDNADFQANHINMNTTPSPTRARAFKEDWDKLNAFAHKKMKERGEE